MPPRTRRISRKCSPATFLRGLRKELSLPETPVTNKEESPPKGESECSSCSVRLFSEGRLSDEHTALEGTHGSESSLQLAFTPGNAVSDYDENSEQEEIQAHTADVFDREFIQNVITQGMIKRFRRPPSTGGQDQFEWAKMLALESMKQLRLYCQNHLQEAKRHYMDLVWLESVSERLLNMLERHQVDYPEHLVGPDSDSLGLMDQLYVVSFVIGAPKSIANFLEAIFEYIQERTDGLG